MPARFSSSRRAPDTVVVAREKLFSFMCCTCHHGPPGPLDHRWGMPHHSGAQTHRNASHRGMGGYPPSLQMPHSSLSRRHPLTSNQSRERIGKQEEHATLAPQTSLAPGDYRAIRGTLCVALLKPRASHALARHVEPSAHRQGRGGRRGGGKRSRATFSSPQARWRSHRVQRITACAEVANDYQIAWRGSRPPSPVEQIVDPARQAASYGLGLAPEPARKEPRHVDVLVRQEDHACWGIRRVVGRSNGRGAAWGVSVWKGTGWEARRRVKMKSSRTFCADGRVGGRLGDGSRLVMARAMASCWSSRCCALARSQHIASASLLTRSRPQESIVPLISP